MEFPHLGQHCSEATCNRLDFLPVKCDSCHKVFCVAHYNYERHDCQNKFRGVQVPVCPLCDQPVPTAPGVAPDLTVSQHIDQQCKSDTKKIYTNRCSAKGCKRKELIPVECTQCHLNFCLRHRHTSDHDCRSVSAGTSAPTVFKATSSTTDTRSMAARAAENRRQNKTSNTLFSLNARPTSQPQRASAAQVQNLQGNMTEDEALARAMALSMMEEEETADGNLRNDLANTAQRVPVGGRDAQQTNGKDKCSLS
ncbi:AN1-type zinc finger protein 2A [Scaptodrosophila lebanonensis]|uniref:AN1-type zinc finger protein 2A n=1 Tax=Drosophila lebanonensis TaxID=7225 RepID=A0A6J2U7E2_DROLE|nr:AN1-type zinc finger protein 2A [Scaptodrosophila lebanonensis]